jgi:hypothetical protein
MRLLDCCFHRIHGGGRDGFEKRLRNGLINRYAAYIEAVESATFDNVLAGTVIAGRGVTASIVSAQSPATMPAHTDSL